MLKTIHAIYEHGVLRPVEPLEGITENANVEVTISLEGGYSASFKICRHIE